MAIVPQSPNTDFTSTTLNGSINDSVQTVTVNDASTIVTPTYAVIDREDNNGVATPNQREVVYVSAKVGNDLTVTRGVDNSTARSHNDSAKFEPMITVGFWDDFYDAYDNDHNPFDGSHDITKVAMLSGATVQTLANKILSTTTIQDLTLVTAANASGASLTGFTLSKVKAFTRDMAAVTGDVAYTGVGFKPSSILFLAVQRASITMSIGISDGSLVDGAIGGLTTSMYGDISNAISLVPVAGNSQVATVKSYDADGFTLTWTKAGTATGTAEIQSLCFR